MPKCNQTNITIKSGENIIQISGSPGPQGPPGEVINASGTLVSLVAEGPIGGHRAVITNDNFKAAYADNTDDTHYGKILGITVNAANDGDTVLVQTTGELEEPSWSFDPGYVFLGTNGLLTQSPPIGGFLAFIGTAITATKLLINIQTNIDLLEV